MCTKQAKTREFDAAHARKQITYVYWIALTGGLLLALFSSLHTVQKLTIANRELEAKIGAYKKVLADRDAGVEIFDGKVIYPSATQKTIADTIPSTATLYCTNCMTTQICNAGGDCY